MDWKEEHKRKKRTIEDVLKLVRDNSTVVVGMTPITLANVKINH
jgi:hypothetical protein